MHIYLNFTSEFGASQCNMWNDCWIKILSHYSGKKIYKALIHWLSNYWKQYPHLARKHICHSSDLLCTREYALSLICVGPLVCVWAFDINPQNHWWPITQNHMVNNEWSSFCSSIIYPELSCTIQWRQVKALGVLFSSQIVEI